MKKIVQCIIAVLVIAAAVAVAFALYANKPASKKRKKQPVQTPVVQVLPLQKQTAPVAVVAYGTVVPARKIDLRMQVEGKIVKLHPQMVPGGILAAGEELLQVDPSDYRFAVEQKRADVTEALYQLELEEGKQVIARKEWQILEREGAAPDQASKSLALREPQLRLARARLEAAKNTLAAAELDLARTRVTAPFNLLVLDESVEKGQLVSRQAPMATLVGTDRFWVKVSVPVNHLPRISFPQDTRHKGSKALIALESDSDKRAIRTGYVLRLLGDLDARGHMARLLVAIDDPLALNGHKQKILLGSYVRVEINAGSLSGVYAIPREALRANDTVWLAGSNGQLVIRQATVRWRRKHDLLVTMDAKKNEEIITSRLQSPLPGMAVQKATPQEKSNGRP